MIPDAILQNPLEQHRELAGRTITIFFGQLHHGVLDDIQRRFLVAQRIRCLPERAPFDGNQKIGQFAGSSQEGFLKKNRGLEGGRNPAARGSSLDQSVSYR